MNRAGSSAEILASKGFSEVHSEVRFIEESSSTPAPQL